MTSQHQLNYPTTSSQLNWPGCTCNESGPYPREFRIGQNVYVFAAKDIHRKLDGYTLRSYMLLKRLDGNELIKPPYLPQIQTPLTSACIHASIQILHQTELRHLAYEHEKDPHVDFRGIVQGIARLYAVDPSEMMGQYSNVRVFLSHKNYTPPQEVESVINKKQMQDHVEVKK